MSPPARGAPRAAPALRDPKKAAAAARRGETDAALAALGALADAGDAAAAAAAAELLAVRGAWAEAARRASQLLAEPDAVYAANVFEDCAAIVRRAADVLGDPGLVTAAAARVPPAFAGPRDAVLLADYYRASEAARNPRPGDLARADALAPSLARLKGKPAALARHRFALAVVHDVDEAILARWDPSAELASFDGALEVARAHVRRGAPEPAWEAIASQVWYPVEKTQVAPVVLVTDFRLWPLMTPERCAAVLARPRGKEALA
ncbi:MAG: hypothetical protein IT385_21410 [Deltaproteobacteria bacterium]|nr:hypothetical protein [Deltaproteobacteria bacterium]